MALNKITVQGRIPFDLKMFNEGDDKKAVVMGTISVRRNFKKQDEEFYPEDLLDFKGFGAQANFINQYFAKGANVIFEGELRRNENYEKDGETQFGQMYIHVTAVHFQNGNGEGGGNNGGGSKPAAKNTGSKPTASKSPVKKSTNPLAGKRQSIL